MNIDVDQIKQMGTTFQKLNRGEAFVEVLPRDISKGNGPSATVLMKIESIKGISNIAHNAVFLETGTLTYVETFRPVIKIDLNCKATFNFKD